MNQPKPLTPFFSTDPRCVEPQAASEAGDPEDVIQSDDDGTRCTCVMTPGVDLTGRELLTGRCADCGRRFR